MSDYSHIPIKFIIANSAKPKIIGNNKAIEVGGYVTAISHNRYAITNDESVCKVLSIDEAENCIFIEVCYHSDPEKKHSVGEQFYVELDQFKPYM